MKYFINDQEVSFLTFKSHLSLNMETIYGDKWVEGLKDQQIDFIIDNMSHNHNQICINETCFLIE